MDWNKTKTIFIIVFSILNVFLLSLYLGRYNESQQMDKPSDTPISEKLAIDNIKILETDLPSKRLRMFQGLSINLL